MLSTNGLACCWLSVTTHGITGPAYLMITHWFSLSIIMFLYMLSARA